MGYLKIYQVGGTIVPLFQQELTNSYRNKSKGKEIELLSSMNPLIRDSQFIHETRDLKVSGYILDIARFKADWLEQMLRSYVGKPLPIIAYYVHNSHIQEFSNCCDCYGNDECCVSFYQAIGIITQVDDLDESDWSEPLELTFSIDLVTHWRGLDPILWNWGSYPLTASNHPIQISNTFINSINAFPSCAELFAACKDCVNGFYPIEYTTLDHMVDTNYLNKRFCDYHCSSGCCNGSYGQIFPNITSGSKHLLNKLQQRHWGMPPLSIYVFEGIEEDSQIKIGVRGNDGGIRTISRDTFIDIETTNEILIDNNLSVIDIYDKIIVGDITVNTENKILRNALIYRDGNFLDIQPVVYFPDLFPAMIYPSDNAQFFATGNFGSLTAAHFFRKA